VPPPPGGGTPPPGGAVGYGQPAGTMPATANFGQRLLAIIVDGLICSAMSIPAFLVGAFGPTEIEPCGSGFPAGSLCEVETSGAYALRLLLMLAAFIGTLAYWSILVGKGQTVGMKMMKIRVVDMNTGQPIGTGRGVGRFFSMYLSALVCYLGFRWMIWDPKSQTWHDKIVSSVVVDA